MPDQLHVRTETRKVYISARGARLSRGAAYRQAARYLMEDDYGCQCETEVGFRCGAHTDEAKDQYLKVRDRLARFLKFVDSRRAA